MDRKRMVAMGFGGVAIAVAAGQMLSGGPAPAPAPVVVAELPAVRVAAATPQAVWTSRAVTQTAQAPVVAAADDPCAMSFEVFAQEGAMIGITLLAPCRAAGRVVLQHGGLMVSMRTMATGSLFATLPAMEISGAVEARFDDGTVLSAMAQVPELAGMRRLAVQWHDADRFALHGFEGAADYGDVGHQTAENGGVLALGDVTATPAFLAEVYTMADPAKVRATIEAEVTDATCGRELLGETLYSSAGAVRKNTLTLAMPECDGAGGFVVLNNPLPDMTLATAE